MLSAIIRFSIRNKLIIGLFTIAWIVWGIIAFSNLPVDALPDVTSNQVQVITVTPALASPEVERLITFPIEQASSNIPGIREIRSISRFGLSVVTIVFTDETDVYWARQQVQERLTLVRDQIPKDAGTPELAPLTTGLGEIYQYLLKPAKGYEQQYGLGELRSIQDWIVRRQLLGTKGVADVSSFGGWMKQYEVAVQPDRLKAMNVSLGELFSALEQNNHNSGGAYIEKANEMLFIRTEGLANNIQDIEQIRIKSTAGGMPIYVTSVADVRIGKAVRYGAMTYGNEGEVAGAVVLMLKGENASNVVKEVKKRIEKIRQTLPEGVELITFYDRTKIVNRAIDTVRTNLMEGALIVIFILVIFLGNLRASMIVASVIPLSMLFAMGMMNIFGVSGNLMSLGALDFGLIVDGAVIIVEAVIHRLYHHHLYEGIISRSDMDEAVETSSSRMMNAAVFGQAIILIVYLPILSLSGIEGKMFRPMAQTVIFALLGAFILSLTYVPMATAVFLGRKIRSKESFSDRIIHRIKNLYGRLLDKCFRYPRLIFGSAAFFLILSFFIASRLGGEFIPKLEEGDFAVDSRLLTGSSLSASVNTALQASTILKRFPEVEQIVTRIGSSEIPTDPMPVEMTDLMITLKDKKTWTSASTFEELADTMSRELQLIPGYTTGFQYPIQMRFNELVAGARQDVVCKLFGENLDTLSGYAGKLGELIHKINGATDVYVEAVTGLPQIVIRYKRDIMGMYGLDITPVNRAIRAAFAGESAGKIYENERRYDLVVRLADEGRQDIEDVRQLLIEAPNGLQVPLANLADIQVEQGPNQIQREDAKRRIIVGFNIRGRDVQSVVEELQKKIQASLPLPPGYFVAFGGQFENLQEAKQRLSIAVPVALALIFIMLYFAFGSLRYGLLIFTAIPFSAIGGILSLWLRDMPFSISAGVGFIALFGVAVLNGIVLITEFNRLQNDGVEDVQDVIREGTLLRLRPVLMTAAVASFGFLPMALSHSAGAEVQRPLATVVIGGLVTATLLTLFVLPLLYQRFSGMEKANKIFGIFIISAFLSIPSSAQISGKPMSLDSMLSLAMQQNLSIAAAKKANVSFDILRSNTFELPPTQVGVEYGNINSFNRDNRFLISQELLLPSVYNSRKQWYEAQWRAGNVSVQMRELDVRREVRRLYGHMQYLLIRNDLIRMMDSAYERFTSAASLRYQTGESTLLEKTAAEAEYSRLQLQKQQLLSQLLALQQQLMQWLHVSDTLLPLSGFFVQQMQQNDSVPLHPEVDYWRQVQRMYQAEAKMEKSRLLPNVTMGYSNLTILGYQSPDGVSQKYYGYGDRFSTLNLSLGLPLFNGATKARIKAGEANRIAAIAQENQRDEALLRKRTQLMREMEQHQQTIQHFSMIAIPQAEKIVRQSMLAYQAGEIAYTEWINLMNQASAIRMGFADAMLSFHLTMAEWEYVNGN